MEKATEVDAPRLNDLVGGWGRVGVRSRSVEAVAPYAHDHVLRRHALDYFRVNLPPLGMRRGHSLASVERSRHRGGMQCVVVAAGPRDTLGRPYVVAHNLAEITPHATK